MEIIDYLRTARRHLMVLLGVPLLAGALAVVYVLLSPRPYTATVYASPPLLMGSQYGTYQGSQGPTQFVYDFSAQAGEQAVVSAVARTKHVSAADVRSGVTVTQVNLSSQVQVTYTTTDRKTAGPVALAVARQTMMRLFAPQVRSASAGVAAATKAMHAANAALATFAKQNGSAPLAGLHADLVARQLAAQATLSNSRQVLAQAQAQEAAATAPQAVQSTPTMRVPRSHRFILTVLPALAVGVLLAIALTALLEVDARRRRVPRGRAPHSPRHDTRARDSSPVLSFSGE